MSQHEPTCAHPALAPGVEPVEVVNGIRRYARAADAVPMYFELPTNEWPQTYAIEEDYLAVAIIHGRGSPAAGEWR